MATRSSIWMQPALWCRVAIVLAAGYGLTFNGASLIFYTAQSNVVVLGYFLVALHAMVTAGEPVTPAPRLRGAVTFWILITGLVAHILLSGGANPLPGLVGGGDLFAEWAVFCLHYVTPALVLVDWLLFVPRRQVGWAVLPLWLAFPLGYALVAMFRAAVYPGFETPYPYYFLDPTEHGPAWVAWQFLQLTVEFVVLGAVLILADRAPGRQPVPSAS